MLKNYVKKFPLINHLARVILDKTIKNRRAIKTINGFKLTGNKMMMSGCFEPVETFVAITILKKSNVFINVGANIGYYLLHSINVGCPINIGIEPLKSNLDCLIKNLDANSWCDFVEIYQTAVSSKVGVVELYGIGTGASIVSGWANSPNNFSNYVPINTLDNIIGSRFNGQNCFVLMDIEGSEYEALKGAKALLDQHPKPIWMVEICVNEHMKDINPNLQSTFEIFFSLGYDAWTCELRPRKIEINEIIEINKTKIDTLKTHNFIFATNEQMMSTDLSTDK
jgi:FkbM family methyltransferase